MLYALYYQLGAKSLTSHLKIKTEKKKRLLSTAWPQSFYQTHVHGRPFCPCMG